MRIHLVQGVHWAVPGRRTTAHLSRDSAARTAAELCDVMLADLGLPASRLPWPERLALAQTLQPEADVWIDVLETED